MRRSISVPAPPSFLKGEALAEWNRVAPELARRGLVDDLDRAALVSYCIAWARLVEAEARLEGHGLVILSPARFPVASPYVAIAQKAHEQLLAAAAQFGMTPASRAGIVSQVPEVPFPAWRG